VQGEEVKKCKLDSQHISLFPHPEKIFFYRGAWEEWDLSICRVIVPMSPSEVDQKMFSILRHQSQKDAPMFPGDDKREFW
jgi:glucosamine-6-phosphate deaminase